MQANTYRKRIRSYNKYDSVIHTLWSSLVHCAEILLVWSMVRNRTYRDIWVQLNYPLHIHTKNEIRYSNPRLHLEGAKLDRIVWENECIEHTWREWSCIEHTEEAELNRTRIERTKQGRTHIVRTELDRTCIERAAGWDTCQGSFFFLIEMVSLSPKDSRRCSPMLVVLCGQGGSIPAFPGYIASILVGRNTSHGLTAVNRW